MSGKHRVMYIVMELIKNGPVKSYDLFDLGYSRTMTNSALSQLVRDKKIFRHGHARASYYTLEQDGVKAVTKTPPRSERETKLPELPELVLHWMGYTNHKPVDPVYVQGYMSRGAE